MSQQWQPHSLLSTRCFADPPASVVHQPVDHLQLVCWSIVISNLQQFSALFLAVHCSASPKLPDVHFWLVHGPPPSQIWTILHALSSLHTSTRSYSAIRIQRKTNNNLAV